APAQAALEEIGGRAGQAGVRRAQEREQVAPVAVEPRITDKGEQGLAGRRLPQPDTPLERVRDAECREGGVEGRPPVVQTWADDGDLLRGGSGAEQTQHLLGDELQRPAQAAAFEEAERAVERRRVA